MVWRYPGKLTKGGLLYPPLLSPNYPCQVWPEGWQLNHGASTCLLANSYSASSAAVAIASNDLWWICKQFTAFFGAVWGHHGQECREIGLRLIFFTHLLVLERTNALITASEENRNNMFSPNPRLPLAIWRAAVRTTVIKLCAPEQCAAPYFPLGEIWM